MKIVGNFKIQDGGWHHIGWGANWEGTGRDEKVVWRAEEMQEKKRDGRGWEGDESGGK